MTFNRMTEDFSFEASYEDLDFLTPEQVKWVPYRVGCYGMVMQLHVEQNYVQFNNMIYVSSVTIN